MSAEPYDLSYLDFPVKPKPSLTQSTGEPDKVIDTAVAAALNGGVEPGGSRILSSTERPNPARTMATDAAPLSDIDLDAIATEAHRR